MEPTVVAVTLQRFFELLAMNQRAKYPVAAALTFCAYDIFLSFGQEVRYIWQTDWSTAKVLYLFVRYYGVLNLIAMAGITNTGGLSYSVCHAYFLWVIPCGLSVFIAALDGILLLRIFALYNRSKRVLAVILPLVAADIATVIWAAVTYSKYLTAHIVVMPSIWQGCASKSPKLRGILVSFLLNYLLSCGCFFGTESCRAKYALRIVIFLAMTLFKLFESHRSRFGRWSWGTWRDTECWSPLLYAFVRDGSVYFALSSCASFLAIVASYIVLRPQVPYFAWTLAILSYSGAHLVLDLRAAGADVDTGSPWDQTLTVPELLHFASPSMRSVG